MKVIEDKLCGEIEISSGEQKLWNKKYHNCHKKLVWNSKAFECENCEKLKSHKMSKYELGGIQKNGGCCFKIFNVKIHQL